MIAIVDKLRHKYPLEELLKLAGIPQSSFYYGVKQLNAPDKDKALKMRIWSLYSRSQKKNESYGYRRIHAMLRQNRKYRNINHKKVQRIMRELGLHGYISKNGHRRYSSYKGTIGRIAENIVKRGFNAKRPNQLWSTDVTEFRLENSAKVYLSPIKDFCDGSIVSYSYSTCPNLELAISMLDKALDKNRCVPGLVFHSDRGWQYQHPKWQQKLEGRCIVQSMSRKGNCLDNSKMETFFAALKKAIWFGREKEYKTPEDLYVAIDDYIYWYNNSRIQIKLKGLPPLLFRKKAFKSTA